jgi:hypothetical protein
MNRWLRIALRAGSLLFALLALAVYGLFFSERPPNQTDPETLQGDGSALNYCDLATLKGEGLLAKDIAKGNTPGCRYDRFPAPILAACTEPLVPDAVDMRGLWQGVDGARIGHVERIEQCGARVVVTSSGLIHDSGPNSTGGLTTNDTEGAVMFMLGDREYCPRTSAEMVWNQGVLDFHVFGWGPVVVRRYLENDQLVWEYADGTTTRMTRICRLPEDQKVPKARGPRIRLI